MSQYTCITYKTCWLDTKFKRTILTSLHERVSHAGRRSLGKLKK